MDKQHVIEMKKTASEVDDAKFQLRQILQNNQIDLLKDTHGAQLERLAHNKEKLKALQTELTERNTYHKRLVDQQNEEQENMIDEHHDFDFNNRHEIKEEDKKDELNLKILDKLTMNLERLTADIDGKLKKEFEFEEGKDDNPKETDPYSKPYFIAICIKYVVKIDKPIEVKKSGGATNILLGEEEQTEQKLENFYFNTFRITKSTTFQQLKNQAADFWGITPDNEKIEKERENTKYAKDIDKPQKKKNIKSSDKFASYELLDEYYNELQIDHGGPQSIESFFQSKGNELTQALLIFRKKEIQSDVKKNEKNEGASKPEAQIFKIRTDEDIMYNEFYKRFPGMKKYIKINISKEKKKSGDGEGFLFNDNHFCVFFWMIIMLILNVLAVVSTMKIDLNYRNNDNILKLLSANPNFKAK